jgi:hypothetical protein
MSVADCVCGPSLPVVKAKLVTALTTVKLGFHFSIGPSGLGPSGFW